MSQKLYRNKNLIHKQREEQFRAKAELALRNAKAQTGSLRDAIEAAFQNAVGSSVIAAHIKGSSPNFNPDQRAAFKSLLLAVEAESDLLEDGGKGYVEACARLASWSSFWLRKPSDWRARSHNKGRQFSALARHLLCEYHVPAFMDFAWTGDRMGNVSCGADICQEWFIHIGTGNNIRKASKLPFPLTKMMAHHFLLAPHEFTPAEALRWGQVKGMGGSDRLAKAIIGSRLGRPACNEGFWLTVINFFIRNSEMLDMSQVGPMMDYLHNQKFVPIQLLGPPQPNLSMEKRTVESLMNQTEAWHRQLAKSKDSKSLVWNSCGIEGFERIEGTEGNRRRFVIEELLSSRELAVEGRVMHHCVYSYGRSCFDGRTAIYSLKGDHGNGLERRVTIEVNPSIRQVTQARTKYNGAANDLDKRIMNAWAAKVGLSLGRYALQRWM